MALTSIEWTGTPLARELVIPHDIRLDNKLWLPAGTYPVGHVVPGFTFNPWLGCMKISEACDHCYAETLVTGRMGYNLTSGDARRRLKVWGPAGVTERVRTSRTYWQRPHLWNKLAARLGVRLKVFCASLADVFEDNPQVDAWRRELFETIEACRNLDWLLLSKRTPLVRERVPTAWRSGLWPEHVWIGATVENERRARERLPHLIELPAPVRFVSVEPLIAPKDGESPLDLVPYLRARERRVDWCIIGGESGPGYRPLPHPLVEKIVAACDAADAWVFVKQDAGPRPGMRGALSDALWSRKEFPRGAVVP